MTRGKTAGCGTAIYKNVTVLPSVLYYPLPRPTPFLGGVYAGGVPVPLAADLKGRRQRLGQAPLLPASSINNAESIYSGPFRPHFGHFLIDTLSMTYYAKRYPDLPFVYSTGCVLAGYHKDILGLLGVRNSITSVSEPTFFPVLHIPVPGFVIGLYSLNEQIKALGVVEPQRVIPGKRIYLSRSRLPKDVGGAVNERELEALLEERGWLVYHPQEHSILHQLHEISSSETVLAIEGSALHSVLLLAEPVKTRFFSILRYQIPQEGEAYGQIARAKALDYNSLVVQGDFYAHSGGKRAMSKIRLDLDYLRQLLDRTGDLSAGYSAFALKSSRPFDNSEVCRIGLYADMTVNNEAPLLYSAKLSLERGETEPAVRLFHQALAACGEPSHVHYNLSLAYAMRQEREKALEHARLAVECGDRLCTPYVRHCCSLCRTSRDSCNAKIMAGLQFIDTGDFAKARSLFFRALSRYDSCALLYYLQALALEEHDPKEGVRRASRALGLAPASRLYGSNLVDMAIRQGRRPLAMQTLRQFIRSFPEQPWSYHALATLLARQKNERGLNAIVTAALSLPSFIPSFGDVTTGMLMRQGFFHEAERALMRALGQTPYEGWIYFHLSNLPRFRQRAREAARLARISVQLAPHIQRYEENLGELRWFAKTGNAASGSAFVEAPGPGRERLWQKFAAPAGQAWKYVFWSVAALINNDREEPFVHLRSATGASRCLVWFWLKCIDILLQKKDYAGAANLAGKALCLAPADARIHLRLSNISLAQGKFGEALKCARAAACIDRKNKACADNLKCLLDKLRLEL